METITVELATKKYDINIATGSLTQVGTQVRRLTQAEKVAIITDRNVDSLYGATVQQTLEQAQFAVTRIVLVPGEESKNLTVLQSVYEQLAAAGITRSDLVLTLGGGVVGDLGGLAAATFLRGVPYIQLPTSLLAQIDSSIGGKVAVDLAGGKNLVGCFYQPLGVFIDPDVLGTLPLRYLQDGMAEVIKYGCSLDAELFARLGSFTNAGELLANIEEVIITCCKLKAEIVARDEFDTGERMLLNFGHTVGHAVEKTYHYHTYTHGEGVSIGMVFLTKRTEKLGLTEAGTTVRLEQLLAQYQLPTTVQLTQEELLAAVQVDKKHQGQRLTLVVLEKIGKARLLQVPCSELTTYLGEEGNN
ncbi:MAG: 3-dehydroquinate synthase [Acidaminococcaceae bacterium]